MFVNPLHLTFALRDYKILSFFTANNLDELARRDFSSHLENSISAGLASSGLLQNSSQPVNIPNSQLTNSISGKIIYNFFFFISIVSHFLSVFLL